MENYLFPKCIVHVWCAHSFFQAGQKIVEVFFGGEGLGVIVSEHHDVDM